MESSAFEPSPVPFTGDKAPATGSVAPRVEPTPTLAELFEAEEAGLLQFALGLVGRRSLAEDLVQEAFMRLHNVWADVEKPRAWLYRSLRNLALNHLRDHRRETELETDSTAAEDTLPSEMMGKNEAVGMVRMLLAELSADDRDLIRLKYQEDFKYQEISQRTGLTVGNVGYRLHHLLKGLADSLRHAGIAGSQG